MNDKDLIRALKLKKGQSEPVDAISFLISAREGDLNQFQMIRFFRAAFPSIPLIVLHEASTAKVLVGAGGLKRDAINELLKPWLCSDDPGEVMP